MTATDELRRMLDERGVEWDYGITGATTTRFSVNGIDLTFTPMRDGLVCSTILTPAEAIAATLGNRYDCDHPEWVEWVDSLNHREVKNIRDAVEKLMHEAITLGGSMGPNDNIEDGWNEGTELTKAYIDGWVETFATLGDADERNSKLFEAAKKWMAKAAHFEAENARLRELCADMYGFIKRMDEDCGDVTFSDCFDYCKHDTADDGCCKTGECWYEQRLRELGIEVDE